MAMVAAKMIIGFFIFPKKVYTQKNIVLKLYITKGKAHKLQGAYEQKE
jgi:hypothetical protein